MHRKQVAAKDYRHVPSGNVFENDVYRMSAISFRPRYDQLLRYIRSHPILSTNSDGFPSLFARKQSWHIITKWFHISGVMCHKQVSRVSKCYYTPQILWDVIAFPCLWYLILAQHSPFENGWGETLSSIILKGHKGHTVQAILLWSNPV